MFWLIMGLILFLGAHSVRIFAPDFRQRFIESRGDNAWKGLYTLISLAGLVLIIWGFSIARYGPIVYDPPLWMRYITELLMLFAFISLAVSSVPAGKLKPALKHPMLLSVKIWALAHLLANGDLASLLLFGSFLVWAVADRISEKRRLKAGITQPTEPGPVRNDVIAGIVGVVAYGLFIWKLHYWFIGVPVHA